MAHENRFYTVPQAASQFGVSRSTMARWVATGKVKSVVTPGGHHRILRSEIHSLLTRNGFSDASARKTASILVVDDDRTVRNALKRRLTREGFAVKTAADGFTAGMKAREMNPDLIVLDLMMAGVDGFEVCRTIKADEALNQTKVLAMTGFDTPENRNRALKEGADGYLSKGSSFSELLRHIQVLLAG